MNPDCDSNRQMTCYYRERAPVYDLVYHYPERQRDLRVLEKRVGEYFAERDLLEVAAGTGYWTQFIAASANSVVATDMISEPLNQIPLRPHCDCVSTRVVDAFELESMGENFDAAFAGLWFSHVAFHESKLAVDGHADVTRHPTVLRVTKQEMTLK